MKVDPRLISLIDLPGQVAKKKKNFAEQTKPTPVIGKWTEDVILGCYRKTGKWCETAHLIFGATIPEYLQRRATMSPVR